MAKYTGISKNTNNIGELITLCEQVPNVLCWPGLGWTFHLQYSRGLQLAMFPAPWVPSQWYHKIYYNIETKNLYEKQNV